MIYVIETILGGAVIIFAVVTLSVVNMRSARRNTAYRKSFDELEAALRGEIAAKNNLVANLQELCDVRLRNIEASEGLVDALRRQIVVLKTRWPEAT